MHDLDIIKIKECLVAKFLLTNVTKMNEHSNVATFVHALVTTITCNMGRRDLPDMYARAQEGKCGHIRQIPTAHVT